MKIKPRINKALLGVLRRKLRRNVSFTLLPKHCDSNNKEILGWAIKAKISGQETDKLFLLSKHYLMFDGNIFFWNTIIEAVKTLAFESNNEIYITKDGMDAIKKGLLTAPENITCVDGSWKIMADENKTEILSPIFY